jgi:5'-methylthioadenosine phosphorylase
MYPLAHPVSPRLRIHIGKAALAEGIDLVRDGTYVCIEGPQFSTLAESLTYKNLGYSVIGMTNMPEAKPAREAEICYATVAMVTDFDCWRPDHDAVTVQDTRHNVSRRGTSPFDDVFGELAVPHLMCAHNGRPPWVVR